ncbi:hypothetical protein AB0K60_35050 [Thermopolyspora sp. NPDC052614]|uniref:hypothetical protein n=1 Tax=Thermopolyspora sp. NPDC052614 TaxID=3155682 RepID=UPI003413B4AB
MTEENKPGAPEQDPTPSAASADDADPKQPGPEGSDRTPKESDQKDASEPPKRDPEDDDVDEKDLGQSATVINNFFADVDASASIFGIGTRPAGRSVTGSLGIEDIDAAVARFVAPPRFEEMVARLRERRVLLLTGPAETGKWTGAVKLLTRMPLADRRITVHSPARDLDHLVSTTTFKKGRGHLIRDWTAAEAASALQRFQFDALRAKLAEADAYLVITLARRVTATGADGYRIDWEPPAPQAVFDAHLGGVEVTAEIEQVREQVGELRSARRIAELARRIREGRGAPAGLLAEISGDDVRAWFDAGPRRSEVLVVAALAFAYGASERVFERLLVDLTALADEVRRQGREPERRPDDDDLPQERCKWTSGHPLITVERADPAEGGERRIVSPGAHHREQVIKELVDRYGYELWEPLRLWIHRLPTDFPEVQLQVVAGVALLARENLGEVQEFLDTWANGTWRERLAAANVLSMMCADDEPALAARRTALGWVENAGQQRAMTAALAFAGGLAIRDPADSVAWLWFLSLRGIRVSTTAQRALTLLFQSAAERTGDILPALRLLAAYVDRDMHEVEFARARRALSAVLAVLDCDRLGAEGEPVAAWVLRSEPDSARWLGVLWRWTLASAFHRADAIRALCRTLETLEGRPGALEAARALGAALWSALPDGFAVLVKQSIRQAVASRSRVNSHKTRELVLALLDAGAGRA